MSERIFTDEQIVKYAETRLFGSNVKPHEVSNIELHNGVLPSHLEAMIGEGFTKVDQKNGREPIYFKEGTLLIPQYSGFSRRDRYETMIQLYKEIIESNWWENNSREIEFESHETKGDTRKTDQNYSNFAYDFVTGLFVPNGNYENKRVFENYDIKDIDTIIFGNINAVAKQSKVLQKGESEYLESQLVEIDGKNVLNLGYVYGDQIGIIIDKLMREYNSLVRKEKKSPGPHRFKPRGIEGIKEIDVYMFGRVGGISRRLKRGDVIRPGVIHGRYPDSTIELDNILGKPKSPFFATYVYYHHQNVSSVLNQNISDLNESSCDTVDMEFLECLNYINWFNGRYKDNLKINL